MPATAHRPYDMYPQHWAHPGSHAGTRPWSEWGPASHDPDNPFGHEAVQRALDLRDDGGERPDDN